MFLNEVPQTFLVKLLHVLKLFPGICLPVFNYLNGSMNRGLFRYDAVNCQQNV